MFPVEYYASLRSFFNTVKSNDEVQIVLQNAEIGEKLISRCITLAVLLALASVLACARMRPTPLPTGCAPPPKKNSRLPKEAVAVVLLDDVQTVVKDNGEIETTHRCAYKLLRPEAREDYGHAFVEFDNETKVSFFRAWTISARTARKSK